MRTHRARYDREMCYYHLMNREKHREHVTMSRSVCLLSIPLLLTIGLSLCRLPMAAEPREPRGNGVPMLSIRESLVPVFAMRHCAADEKLCPYSRKKFPHGRLNPGIAKYLRVCLQEQVELASPLRTQRGALLCLGLVCTPEDIKWVDSYVEAFLAGFHDRGGDPQYSLAFAGAIGRFGGMALMRHPEAARHFVEKFSRVASWAPYGTSVKSRARISWGRRACGRFALHGYANSKSQILHDLLREQFDAPEEETLDIHRKLVERCCPGSP